MVVGVCGAVWLWYLWFVVVWVSVACVCGTVSLVDWFVWLCGRGNVWKPDAGLGENGVDMVWVCLYSWCINSEEKNFEKGFGKGMAMNLLVHKN